MFGFGVWELLIIAGLIIVVIQRHSPRTEQALPKLWASLAVIVVAIAVFAGFFWSRGHVSTETINWQWTKHGNETQVAPLRLEPALPVMERPSVAEALPVTPNAELPEWTRKTSYVDGANTFVVVKSGRFATLDEAELHAFDEAGHAAARHYRHLDPSGVGRCAPSQRQMVRDSAIRDRFEEISRHDFGAMKDYPMHQVWLRVELSPQLGQRFAEPWRQATVATRLHALTVWSIWGTAAAALIAFALRLDTAWNGRRRAVIVGTAAALMLASLAFLV